MKVTLINPPYMFWKSGVQYLERVLGHAPPLGLLSLAAYARSNLPRISIAIVDAAANSLSVSQTVDRIVRLEPDVVGFTITTMVVDSVQEIASQIKAVLPNVKLVAGGPHISGLGQHCLYQLCDFDVAVVGEGEQTFVELIKAFETGRTLDDIAGIVFRDAHGRVRTTKARAYFDDLDKLPLPAWDLLEGFPHAYRTNIFFSPGGPAATLITSRGCPFHCAFCDQSTFGHSYRITSAEYVYRAVKQLQDRYKVRYIVFCDDTFTIDRRRILEVCRLLQTLPRPIKWSCDANVMTIDNQMLVEMKRAGCWSISYGLESGSPRLLASLNKKITLEKASDVICNTNSAGIYAKGLFILGTPEESLDTVRETQDFISSIPLSTINVSKFTPYPGSELYKEISRNLNIKFEQLNGMNFVVPSKYLSIEQLEEQYKAVLNRFYHTLRAWRFHLPIIFGSGGNIWRMASIVPDVVLAKMRRNVRVRCC